MNAISINVGSSSQDVNGRGYIDPVDLTFQYLPIPETKPIKRSIPRYKELKLKDMTILIEPNHFVHFDPEFCTYTYGHKERGYGDVRALFSLKKGDYLFFHATLSHYEKPSLWLTAIIGYFVLEENVYDCRHLTKEKIEEKYGERFKYNAHLKRIDPSVDFLISGTKDSELLRHAIPLSTFSNPRQLNEEFKDNVATVTGKQISDGKDWFRWTLRINNPNKIIQRGNKKGYLYMYTMTEDSGFAPHVKDDWITLACCAGPVREHAEIGDFILGVSGKTMKNVPQHTPIYLMQVDEKLVFEKYFQHERFIGRVDNIYEKKEGKYVQNRQHIRDKTYVSYHKRKDDTKQSEYVLASRHFYYFGNYWKINDMKSLHEEMKKFRDKVNFTYTTGGHYKKLTADDACSTRLLRFIIDNFAVGKNGEPNHLPVHKTKTKCHKHTAQ